MANQGRIGKTAPTVATSGGVTRVTYHSTVVVEFTAEMVTLNSNRYRTVTTKTRMNQASNQFDLGFTVWQKSGEWFVTFKGEDRKFYDGMCLSR